MNIITVNELYVGQTVTYSESNKHPDFYGKPSISAYAGYTGQVEGLTEYGFTINSKTSKLVCNIITKPLYLVIDGVLFKIESQQKTAIDKIKNIFEKLIWKK